MLQLLCFKAGSFSFHAPFFSITGCKMLHFSGKCLGKTFGILGMGSINNNIARLGSGTRLPLEFSGQFTLILALLSGLFDVWPLC